MGAAGVGGLLGLEGRILDPEVPYLYRVPYECLREEAHPPAPAGHIQEELHKRAPAGMVVTAHPAQGAAQLPGPWGQWAGTLVAHSGE